MALVAMLAVSADAFTSPVPKVSSSQQSSSTNTQLFGTTKQPPEIPAPKELSYGEESRKYRRTVYTHDDWVKHRSPERFTRNLMSTTNSGIYKNIGNEVLATTGVALFVVLWNMLTGTYTDFAGVEHLGILKDTILPVFSLPLAPFTLSSPSLGLLLVFRTNAGYQRWDEARKNWGYVIVIMLRRL
jgi:ion channel-forming bestrophin family protein